MAQVKAGWILFPKAEAFSSKENFLASGKATQVNLPNYSIAVEHLLEDPVPCILLVFSVSMNQNIATVHFDCFLHFSLMQWGV